MTTKQAATHARRIDWDVNEAVAYTVALLTECNAHTLADAVQLMWDQEQAKSEEIEA